MKKWLVTCLLAIALLFVATTAMAGHTKANGEYCLGGSYALLKEYENQHLLRCNDCQEEILENHWIGQEATCIRKAQCGGCTARFGDYGPHDWGEWKSNGNGTHTRVCKHNASHTETKDCTFSAAPCTVPAACTECGAVYKLGHDWGAWTSNGNKTHTHTCKRDASHIETENCNIREATCTDPAWCRECYGEYGSADPSKHKWMFCHSNGNGTHTRVCSLDSTHTETSDCSGVRCGETGWCDECNGRYTASHKFNGPWLSNPDKHWRACIYCNEAGSRASHSFVEQPDARYLKSEATCASPAVYYKVCSDCGYQTPSTFESGDIDPNNHDLQRHEEVKAPTCTEKGWSAYYTCSRCDYTAYQETDALDHDWNNWISNGNKTHTRTCKRDPSHTETEACSGVSCGDTGACSVCGGAYTVEHKYDESSWSCDDAGHWRNCVYCHEKGETASHSFEMHEQTAATCVSKAVYARVCSDCDYHGGNFIFGNINPDNHDLIPHAGKAATCTEKGWKAYNTCSRCDYSAYEELAALGHDPIPHAGKAATCTESGWEAYDTCKRCDYSTYVELAIDPDNHDLVHHEAQAPTCTEVGWEAYDTCSRCNYSTYVELPIDPDNHDLVHHEAKAPTCTEIGWEAYDTCSRCDYSTYVELAIDPDNHDLVHHEAKAPTCTEIGWEAYDTCSRCDYSTYVELAIDPDNHDLVHHEAKAPTCTEIGWEAYDTCSRCDYSTYVELAIDPDNHDLVHHEAKAPTCTEIGWDAYDTCSRCDYTTKVELPALKHNLVHHDAKAPACTEIGWDEYDTCSRCDYTTYQEIPALKHNLVHHDAKAPTCTEIGWDEYDTCSRCDYTTKVEIPALEHDYTEKVIKPTCGKGGYTLHTCKKCNDSYKDHQTKTLLHWYGEWTSNGDGTHSATCKRKDCKHVGKTECAIVEFKQDEATRTLCPVCGNVSDGTHLALVEEVTAEGEHLPYGELVLRMGETANGNTLLSVCFEVSGKLTQPKGEVKITMPADLLNGVTLALLNADGTEIDLPYIVEGENAVFTLDFTDAEIPTALIRLIPTAE